VTTRFRFPPEFAWGISTSSYQFEESADVGDGAGWFETDWDRCLVSRRKAPPRGGATWSWSHFEKDLQALKELGVTHYRLGLEWARIEPKPGRYNEAAIDRYVEMAEKLRAAGIEPIVCLWHFTFPSWLYQAKRPGESNWLHPEARTRWLAFFRKILPRLSPTVRIFAPQNEPNGQLVTAYLGGLWPPATHFRFNLYNRAMEACVRHFQDAAAAIRRVDSTARVLSIHALPWWIDGQLDARHVLYRQLEDANYLHLGKVAGVCDWLGINYYYSQVTSPVSFLAFGKHRGPNYSMMGWRIDPDGLYNQIREVGARYGKPMFITENGVATLNEEKRIAYFEKHLRAVERAVLEGVDVRGYFVWSLVDNYEWHYGYEAKFGLSAMNPVTHDREWRSSGDWYRDTIRASRGSK